MFTMYNVFDHSDRWTFQNLNNVVERIAGPGASWGFEGGPATQSLTGNVSIVVRSADGRFCGRWMTDVDAAR